MAKAKNEGSEALENANIPEQKLYEECKVEVVYQRDARGEVIGIEFEKGKLLKSNIRMEEWRVNDLNAQSVNSKTRLYEQK